MLVPIGEFIHNTVCGRLLCFPTYIFSFLTPLFTIFNNPDWVCNFARLCISKSIDDYEMHFACT